MATIDHCPSCGEGERLRGRTLDSDIEVRCETCGAHWLRGASRCNACGRSDVVLRLQVMTRHPRGNQLAIIGRRELPLCPACDADAIAGSLASNRPIPETYVSVFLLGRQGLLRPPAPAAEQTETFAPRETETTKAVAADPVAPPPPRAVAKRSAQKELVQPTVRQAIEDYLTAQPEADSLAMLFLGQHLGPATRLEVLDRPDAAEALSRWFDSTWTGRLSDRRHAAAAAIAGAVDHWRSERWVATDAAAAIRGDRSPPAGPAGA